MSLIVRPVSPSDLAQLQLGIEFLTDVPEATTEAGLIIDPPGTPTVYSYATQLLEKNVSFSQVAMAVDSLMFGVTDNIAELTKLATKFLPPQVANAIANGFNPTVYGAEALGLALAGGNGTSNNFGSDFGSLSVTQFASEVASITGVNTGAIQGFAQNWINFYSANPGGTFGLSVTLASYGAAFGDAVGAALLNPTANGTLALLTSDVQNALIDNVNAIIDNGVYIVGIPLVAEPPHPPLQGEAFPIPDAGVAPYGPTLDWASLVGTFNYAQFSSAQLGPLTILNAPATFTLDTQHYGGSFPNSEEVISAAGDGNLFTLILGPGAERFGGLTVTGYPTVHILASGGMNVNIADVLTSLVVIPPAHSNDQLVISGSGFLQLGGGLNEEGNVSVAVFGGTITDVGVGLELYGVTDATMIDASNAPSLRMYLPASIAGNALGVTVLGGTSLNLLQGSLGGIVSTVTFTNGTTGLSATMVGADNIIGGPGNDLSDLIYGDGGPDSIMLNSASDRVIFGQDHTLNASGNILAITDGSDQAYPGFWGVTVPTAIPTLFPGSTGGTSTDVTTITGFRAGSGGDVLEFNAVAWNGASDSLVNNLPVLADKGDLVGLSGSIKSYVTQLSTVWVNSGSNSSLKATDNVLLYAPSDVSVQNAQQLAAQLHTSFGAVLLPGAILAGHDVHILVAYDASSNVNATIQHAVNVADVDLVNTSANNQTSTENVNVYASDMVHLTGVSLTGLTSDNIFL